MASSGDSEPRLIVALSSVRRDRRPGRLQPEVAPGVAATIAALTHLHCAMRSALPPCRARERSNCRKLSVKPCAATSRAVS